jgi:GNAT superfamily N-acetyltransferase
VSQFVVESFIDSVWTWKSQVIQYPLRGPKGISLFNAEIDAKEIHCLLYRDKNGKVRGILNHYPFNMPSRSNSAELIEKAGNVNVWTDPKFQRRGIATKLLADADERWNLNFAQQLYTAEGHALVVSYLENRSLKVLMDGYQILPDFNELKLFHKRTAD